MSDIDSASSRTQRGHTAPNAPAAAASVVCTDRAGKRYQLGARFGRSGNVYEAACPQLAERIVVKVFAGATRVDDFAMEGFARDLASAAALNHPYIGRALGMGRLEDGTPFVVMERPRGETLEEQIERRTNLPLPEAHALLGGVISALSVAHATGLVHGALGADDIFVVDGDPSATRLVGFGERHLMQRPRARDAQAPGHDLEPHDDQVALAAIAHQMFSGMKPIALGSSGQQKEGPARWATARPIRFGAVGLPRGSTPRKAGAGSLVKTADDSMTRQFFEEGDRLFNEHAEDPADAQAHDEPQTRLRIPRRRGAAVAWTLAIVGAMAALLVGGWSSVRKPLLAALSRGEAAIGAERSPVDNIAAPSQSVPTRQPASTAPASPPVAAAPAVAFAPALQRPATAPSEIATPAVSPARAPAAGPRASTHPPPSPLRGYVWSPAEHRLVPSR
jgi:hypothetical protein